jgi:hypothetical protein
MSRQAIILMQKHYKISGPSWKKKFTWHLGSEIIFVANADENEVF